ncbi:unnamed protein product [Heligmosomoides polygyrus]|uniref:Uncharacterized protein n=1 Tax=Heligmosomoides polygyrus TaxID=6339 RepID=A0A3P8CJ84_HELPZ|nr:unnamed protein product [Heligmosomoides polygyrus]
MEKSHTPDDAYLASDVWESEAKREVIAVQLAVQERVTDLKEFLSGIPTHGCEKQEGGTQYADRFIIGFEVFLDMLQWDLCGENRNVADYTRRLENGYWQYSVLCVQLLSGYRNKFRDLFSFLEKSHTPDDAYLASDVWESEAKREVIAVQLAVQERVTDLKEFLSGIPTHGCEKQEGGTQYADRFIIGQIENAIKQVPKKQWGFRKCSINPSVLYRAELYDGKSCADPDADFLLLDRVVYTLQGTSVPFGSHGTVVGLSSGSVEVLFDHEFNSGYKIRGAMNSGSRVPKTSLINITYGKTRKGHVVEPAEKLKSRGDSQFIRRKDKRLFAGKECHTSKTKEPESQSASKFLESFSFRPEVSGNNHTNKAQSVTLSSRCLMSNPSFGAPTLLKEVVESELARVLGIKTPKRAADSEDKKSTTALLKLLNKPSPENVPHVHSGEANVKPSVGGHSAAFTKLFPQTPPQTDENIVCPMVLSVMQAQTSAKSEVHPVRTPLPLRGGRGFYRGDAFRRPPVIPRNFVPFSLLPPVHLTTNRVSPGPSVQQCKDPKLTDLKPSSVGS